MLCIDEGVVTWPAIMYEIFGPRGIENISTTLKEFPIRPEELEVEHLETYPFVLKNLRQRSLEPYGYIHLPVRPYTQRMGYRESFSLKTH